MQVSAQNSLTWLQTSPAAVAAADQISSAYGQVSPGDDASGADSGQSAISALQSPSQMFGAASLGSLISSQSDAGDGASAATSSAEASSAATTGAPPVHHHHHHGGGPPPATDTQDPSGTSSAATTATTAAAATDSADASAETDLSQLLANL